MHKSAKFALCIINSNLKKGERMAALFSKTQKACVTCNFWSGSRDLAPCNQRVTAQPNASGKCMTGVYKGIDKMAIANCDKWVPWGVFK